MIYEVVRLNFCREENLVDFLALKWYSCFGKRI